MKKEDRRAKAMQKNKRKKQLIVTVCASVAVVIALALIFMIVQHGKTRVFGDGAQAVTLRDDGTFAAKFYHGEARSGTYTEQVENGATIISFMDDDKTEIGYIMSNVLTIPAEWDDGHGHGTYFTLQGFLQAALFSP